MQNENLKLLILGDLYNSDEKVESEIDQISELNLQDLIYGDNPKYGWFDCIQEVKDRLLAINLSKEQLAKVTLLSAECCETHSMIMPNWDGEGEEFDLTSLAGIENLINLECLELLDLSKVKDMEILLELNLEEISDCSGLSSELESQLTAKGVSIC